MIYECDQCSKALPPGATACPNCGEAFEYAVPADAEVPRKAVKKGFTAVKPVKELKHGGGYDWLEAPADTPTFASVSQKPSRGFSFFLTILVAGVLLWFFNSLHNSAASIINPSPAADSISSPSPAASLQQDYDALEIGSSQANIMNIVGRAPDLTYTGSNGADVLQWKDRSVNVLRVMLTGDQVVGASYVPASGGLDASEIKGRTL